MKVNQPNMGELPDIQLYFSEHGVDAMEQLSVFLEQIGKALEGPSDRVYALLENGYLTEEQARRFERRVNGIIGILPSVASLGMETDDSNDLDLFMLSMMIRLGNTQLLDEMFDEFEVGPDERLLLTTLDQLYIRYQKQELTEDPKDKLDASSKLAILYEGTPERDRYTPEEIHSALISVIESVMNGNIDSAVESFKAHTLRMAQEVTLREKKTAEKIVSTKKKYPNSAFLVKFGSNHSFLARYIRSGLHNELPGEQALMTKHFIIDDVLSTTYTFNPDAVAVKKIILGGMSENALTEFEWYLATFCFAIYSQLIHAYTNSNTDVSEQEVQSFLENVNKVFGTITSIEMIQDFLKDVATKGLVGAIFGTEGENSEEDNNKVEG